MLRRIIQDKYNIINDNKVIIVLRNGRVTALEEKLRLNNSDNRSFHVKSSLEKPQSIRQIMTKKAILESATKD